MVHSQAKSLQAAGATESGTSSNTTGDFLLRYKSVYGASCWVSPFLPPVEEGVSLPLTLRARLMAASMFASSLSSRAVSTVCTWYVMTCTRTCAHVSSQSPRVRLAPCLDRHGLRTQARPSPPLAK